MTKEEILKKISIKESKIRFLAKNAFRFGSVITDAEKAEDATEVSKIKKEIEELKKLL